MIPCEFCSAELIPYSTEICCWERKEEVRLEAAEFEAEYEREAKMMEELN